MNCESCGHPLSLHDPCAAIVPGRRKRDPSAPCPCRRYEPHDRKVRAAMLTDTAKGIPPTLEHAQMRDNITAQKGVH